MTAFYSEEFVQWVRSKDFTLRAKRAVDHILEHGSVTTAELNRIGYDHPPRAIADIKDAGVAVVRNMVRINGRRMAQYSLDPDGGSDSFTGRRAIPKTLRDQIFAGTDHHCAVCGGQFTSRELQADHKIPYRIVGDGPRLDIDQYMPLCPSDNRAKSWSCEHCSNWTDRSVEMCTKCMWASPESYDHIAGIPERRLVVTWTDGEVKSHDKLAREASAAHIPLATYVKKLLATNRGSENAAPEIDR